MVDLRDKIRRDRQHRRGRNAEMEGHLSSQEGGRGFGDGGQRLKVGSSLVIKTQASGLETAH